MDMFAGRNKTAMLAICAEIHGFNTKYNSRLLTIVGSHLHRHRPDLDDRLATYDEIKPDDRAVSAVSSAIHLDF